MTIARPAPEFKKYTFEYYALLGMGLLMVIISGVLSVRSSHFHYEATLVCASSLVTIPLYMHTPVNMPTHFVLSDTSLLMFRDWSL